MVQKIMDTIKNSELLTLLCLILLTLLFTFIIFKVINHVFKVMRKKHDEKKLYFNFVRKMLKCIVVCLAVINVGLRIPSFEKVLLSAVASSGIIAFILGFAAQEPLSNLINGVFISIFRPFVVGDRVKLINQGLTGFIEDITLRHTIIRTFENNRIIITNTVMNKEVIENSNFIDTRVCNFLDVLITYESDVVLAMEILTNMVKNHQLHIDYRSEKDITDGVEESIVYIRNLTQNGIELRSSIWTNTVAQNFQICSDLRLEILKQFADNDIIIAYNTFRLIS